MIVSIAILLVAVVFSTSLIVALKVFVAHFNFADEREKLVGDMEHLQAEMQTKDAELKRLQSRDMSSTKYIRELSEQNAVYKRMISSVRCGSESGSHSDNDA